MTTGRPQRYDPVGRCIYCGTTDDLTNEHVIPYGLSDREVLVLPKSTCRQCAAVTGRVEQQVLRGPLWAVRVYRNLKSRTKHKDAPKTYPLTVVRNGREECVELPVHEFPIVLWFPVFEPPAHVGPAAVQGGITVLRVHAVLFGPSPVQVAKKLCAEEIKISHCHQSVAFARMIAKIAYPYAVGEGRIDVAQRRLPVVSGIMCQTGDVGRWVGTVNDAPDRREGVLHRLGIIEDRRHRRLIGLVQLFSDSETPTYGVLLGSL